MGRNCKFSLLIIILLIVSSFNLQLFFDMNDFLLDENEVFDPNQNVNSTADTEFIESAQTEIKYQNLSTIDESIDYLSTSEFELADKPYTLTDYSKDSSTISWVENPAPGTEFYYTSQSVPKSSSIYEKMLLLTNDNSTHSIIFTISGSPSFLAIDGASQSSIISVKFNISSPTGTQDYEKLTTKDSGFERFITLPENGEWNLTLTKESLGNTTVWVQIVIPGQGTYLIDSINDIYKDYSLFNAGQASYYLIEISDPNTERWFDFNIRNLGSGTLYRYLYNPSLTILASGSITGTYDIKSDLTTGYYLLRVYNRGGTEIFMQIHLSNTDDGIIATTSTDSYKKYVRFNYPYEAILYSIDIDSDIDWFVSTGASQLTSSRSVYFYLYSLVTNTVTVVTSATSSTFTSVFKSLINDPEDEYILRVSNSGIGENYYCMEIDWEGSNEDTTITDSLYFSFKRSGLSMVKTFHVDAFDRVSFSLYSNFNYFYARIYDSNYNYLTELSPTTNVYREATYSPFESGDYIIFLCGTGNTTADNSYYDTYALLSINKASTAEVIYDTDDTLTFSSNYDGCSHYLKVETDYNASQLVSTSIQSTHPYSDSYSYVWKIEQSGAEYIAVHFKRISLLSYDYIYVRDKYNRTMYTYTNINTRYLWVGYIQSDTVFIQISTSSSNNDWGFEIDKYHYLNNLSEKPTSYLALTNPIGNIAYCYVYGSDLSRNSYTFDQTSDCSLYSLEFPETYYIIINVYDNSGIRISKYSNIGDSIPISLPAKYQNDLNYIGDLVGFSFNVNASCEYLAFCYSVPTYSRLYIYNPNHDQIRYETYGEKQYFITNPLLGNWTILLIHNYDLAFKISIMTSDGEDATYNDVDANSNVRIEDTSAQYAIKYNSFDADMLFSSFGGYGTTYFDYRYIGDPTFKIYTNSTWKATTTSESGWTLPEFDDSLWSSADSPHLGKTSKPYWYPDLYDTQGEWIWGTSSDSTSGYSYFRKSFTLSSLPEECIAAFTAYDRFYLYVNGIYLGYVNGFNTFVVDIAPYLELGNNIIAIYCEAMSGYDGIIGEIYGYQIDRTIYTRSYASGSFYTGNTKSLTPSVNEFLVIITGSASSNLTMRMRTDKHSNNISKEARGYIDVDFYGDSYLLKLNTSYDWMHLHTSLQNAQNMRFNLMNSTTILKAETKTSTGNIFDYKGAALENLWLFIYGEPGSRCLFNLITNSTILPTLPNNQSLEFNCYRDVQYYDVETDINALLLNIVLNSLATTEMKIFKDYTEIYSDTAGNVNPAIFFTREINTSYLVQFIGDSSTQNNVSWTTNMKNVQYPSILTQEIDDYYECYRYKFELNITDYLYFNITNVNSLDSRVMLYNPSGELEFSYLFTTIYQRDHEIEFPQPGFWFLVIVGQTGANVNIAIGIKNIGPIELPISVSFATPNNYDILNETIDIVVNANCAYGCLKLTYSGYINIQMNETGYNEWYALRYDIGSGLFITTINSLRFPDGHATITAVFRDLLGHIGAASIFVIIDNNASAPHDWNIVVDDDPPTIIPIAPAYNNTGVNGLYTLKLDIQDETGIATADISLDNRTTWVPLLYNINSGYYEYTFDTNDPTIEIIWINCSDYWGFYNNATFIISRPEFGSSTDGWIIYIDNQEPQVNIISPSSDGATIGGNYTLEFELIDFSEIDIAQISVDDGLTFNDLIFNLTTGYYEYTWDIANGLEISELILRVGDNLSNIGLFNISLTYDHNIIDEFDIVADVGAPFIEILNDKIGIHTDFYIRVNDTSAIQSVRIGLYEGTEWHLMTLSSTNPSNTEQVYYVHLYIPSAIYDYFIIQTTDVWGNSEDYYINLNYMDDDTHTTLFSVDIDVQAPSFTYISDDYVILETDDPYIVQWKIVDNNPLSYSIYVNSFSSFNLDYALPVVYNKTFISGSLISFDLLPYRNYHSVTIIIEDEFGNTARNTISYTLYQLEAPEVSLYSYDPNAEHYRNSDIQFSIKIFDHSPNFYSVTINNISYSYDEWINEGLIIEFFIDEQMKTDYNIKKEIRVFVEAIDQFDLRATYNFYIELEIRLTPIIVSAVISTIILVPTVFITWKKGLLGKIFKSKKKIENQENLDNQ